MEELFIYLLKSSGLIAAFFLSYHFLLRKETFFNSNRWFLLAGLLTSVLLPLFFIKKIIFVPKPVCVETVTTATNAAACKPTLAAAPVPPPFDWMQLLTVGYIVVVSLLVLKVLFNVFSLFRLLHNRKVEKQETFAFVDLQENIAPFSFFNFIVFNSSLYTQSEMESILLHEKVHSQQKHSVDMLAAKIFSILFWFNPFVWLYKKAIIQNLEYIADNKAVQLIEDKKVYQKALLKVVTHQNCLSITNHFYQSLIKKRIVMLNKNQSHKRNSWKYTVVIPALVAFIVFFQVKVIARELVSNPAIPTAVAAAADTESIYVTINKNSTDAQMKRSADLLKEKYGIKLKFSKIKRNSNGEITAIKVEFKDKEGNSGVQQFNSKEPIKPIHFFKNGNKIGFGASKSKVYARNHDNNVQVIITDPKDAEDALSPEAPLAIEDIVIEVPGVDIAEPLAPLNGIGAGSRVYIQDEDGDHEIVIVDGEVIKNGKKVKRDLKKSYTYSFSNGQNGAMSADDIVRIKTDALNTARMSIKKMRPEMMAQARKEMEKARVYARAARPAMEKVRVEMAKAREKSREDMERSEPEIIKARAEMLQAKEEMLKAKAEMEQAKAELEKAKAEMKAKK